ncbi:hypothetical protein [Streptomyces sp. NPDC023588]|uniref:hypothetical protein n=1 Tax=Streptomyces sp. NPDC023588 TaxID=3154907 RepID=UPI0033C6D0E5
MNVEIRTDTTDVASFTGHDAATLLKAAGEWLAAQRDATLYGVNLVPFYLCPDDCEPVKGQPGVRLDLTVDLNGHRPVGHPRLVDPRD